MPLTPKQKAALARQQSEYEQKLLELRLAFVTEQNLVKFYDLALRVERVLAAMAGGGELTGAAWRLRAYAEDAVPAWFRQARDDEAAAHHALGHLGDAADLERPEDAAAAQPGERVSQVEALAPPAPLPEPTPPMRCTFHAAERYVERFARELSFEQAHAALRQFSRRVRYVGPAYDGFRLVFEVAERPEVLLVVAEEQAVRTIVTVLDARRREELARPPKAVDGR